MIKLSPPSFEYILYLVNETSEQNKYSKQRASDTATKCYADSYEVGDSGTITFYLIGTDENPDTGEKKRVKIAILSYPKEKWSACVLSVNNKLIVFEKGQGAISTISHSHIQKQSNKPRQSVDIESNSIPEEEESYELKQEKAGLELENLLSMPNEGIEGNTPTINTNNSSVNMPGVMVNSYEEKRKKDKEKNQFLEKCLKYYVRDLETTFDIKKFMTYLHRNHKEEMTNLSINETDVIWVISKSLRERKVNYTHFLDESVHNILDLTLPDIMKRNWENKLQPILEILHLSDETKNVTVIDLSAWLAKNKF